MTSPTASEGALRISHKLSGHANIGETYEQWEQRRLETALWIDAQMHADLTRLRASHGELVAALQETISEWKKLRGLQRTNCGLNFTSSMARLSVALTRHHQRSQPKP
jgi:hypothetical protein